MLREFRTVLPLIAAVVTALSVYWVLRGALGVPASDIFDGGIIGAAFVGAAYLGVRR